MKSSKLLLKFLLLAFLFVGCTVGVTSRKSATVSVGIDTSASKTKTIVSQDGVVKLTVPSRWQNIWAEANKEQWSLLIGEQSQVTQIGVRSIAKADYPTITSSMHARAALQAGKAPFANAEIIEQGKSITVNGYPAKLYQVEGTTSGQRLVTLSLSVETPDFYHGVLVVSPKLNFAQNQNELNQIIQSLQEQ